MRFLAEAIAHLARALAIREQKNDTVYVGTTCTVVGEAYLGTGKPKEARTMLARAVEVWEHSESPSDLAAALKGLAKAEIGLGRPLAAIPLVDRALTLTRDLPTNNPDFQGDARFVLADALWSTGQRRRALAVVREAHAIYTGLGKSASSERDEVAAWLRARVGALSERAPSVSPDFSLAQLPRPAQSHRGRSP